MWFKWFKNYPKRYKAMDMGIATVFSLLAFVAGLVWWILSRFQNIEALILAIVGVGIFCLFRFLTRNTLYPEQEEQQDQEGTEA